MSRVKRLLLILLIFILVAGGGFFAVKYNESQKELEAVRSIQGTERYNVKALAFLQIFIEKVIKSDKEVTFETRLQLESSVRELNDPAVLAKWQTFVDSKTETEAQANVKDLLALLVARAKTK